LTTPTITELELQPKAVMVIKMKLLEL